MRKKVKVRACEVPEAAGVKIFVSARQATAAGERVCVHLYPEETSRLIDDLTKALYKTLSKR